MMNLAIRFLLRDQVYHVNKEKNNEK